MTGISPCCLRTSLFLPRYFIPILPRVASSWYWPEFPLLCQSYFYSSVTESGVHAIHDPSPCYSTVFNTMPRPATYLTLFSSVDTVAPVKPLLHTSKCHSQLLGEPAWDLLSRNSSLIYSVPGAGVPVVCCWMSWPRTGSSLLSPAYLTLFSPVSDTGMPVPPVGWVVPGLSLLSCDLLI